MLVSIPVFHGARMICPLPALKRDRNSSDSSRKISEVGRCESRQTCTSAFSPKGRRVHYDSVKAPRMASRIASKSVFCLDSFGFLLG